MEVLRLILKNYKMRDNYVIVQFPFTKEKRFLQRNSADFEL